VETYGTARQPTDDNLIQRMRFARWITKATHTHTHTSCFSRQQWLGPRTPVLRLYLDYLSCWI
jgi:hypothetical protein